jgi:hypothetical protein
MPPVAIILNFVNEIFQFSMSIKFVIPMNHLVKGKLHGQL